MIEYFRNNISSYDFTVEEVYRNYAITRQAHSKALSRKLSILEKEVLYINMMYEARTLHPGMGLRKMYDQWKPEGIGRDAFICLGMQEGLRLRKIMNPMKTTKGIKNDKYKNLLENKEFTGVNQIWVSDLFYFPIEGEHFYVVLIMDLYSRRIIGYHASDNMRAENFVSALRMSLTLRGIKDYINGLIHHSDRGSQYLSEVYTSILYDYNIQISMCADVLENAHMERVNGTIKNDYLNRWDIKSFPELRKRIKQAVKNYNNRIHESLNKMTPNEYETYIKTVPMNKRKPLKVFTINKQNNDNPAQLELFNKVLIK